MPNAALRQRHMVALGAVQAHAWTDASPVQLEQNVCNIHYHWYFTVLKDNAHNLYILRDL